MGNAVFPTNLPGLEWGVKWRPKFFNRVQRAASGKELRAANAAYPLWEFGLSYAVLRSNSLAELQTLVGFFLNRQGSFDSFLYINPEDSSVTDQQIGIGNASNRNFQLVRSFGGFAEPVQNVNGSITVKINGSTTSAYTIDSAGLITFTTAPASGAVVTWTGSYYYRVRFLDDEAEFENFLYKLWQLKKIEFVGSVMNKV